METAHKDASAMPSFFAILAPISEEWYLLGVELMPPVAGALTRCTTLWIKFLQIFEGLRTLRV